MPDQLDQINVTTQKYIRETPKLVDDIFNQDPLNYFMRNSLKEVFPGGTSINEDFIYDGLIGGAYSKGKQFNTAQKQVEQQLRFDMKLNQVGVSLYEEDIEVFNKGPMAAISLLKTRINVAYMTLGAHVSIAAYFNGQNVGYTNNLNGLPEIINDGINQSWDGNTYATYGTLTRATYAPSLSSTPRNMAGGTLEYTTIDDVYMSAFQGSGEFEPNLMVTTPRGFSMLKTKFQNQQRYTTASIAEVGFKGLEFNGATLLVSRYCPGQDMTGPAGAGTNDRIATGYLSETSGGLVTTYPVGNLTATGETLWILNARNPFLNYYVSNSSKFGGGFRDFIPAANSTVLVGQVLLAHQMTGHPRFHRQIYGFSS